MPSAIKQSQGSAGVVGALATEVIDLMGTTRRWKLADKFSTQRACMGAKVHPDQSAELLTGVIMGVAAYTNCEDVHKRKCHGLPESKKDAIVAELLGPRSGT
jgi:hypothetical protein